MIKVEFALGDGAQDGAHGQLFLQQAETVRLAGEAGGLPVTRAKRGDTVLVRTTALGTHVGRSITARVTER